MRQRIKRHVGPSLTMIPKPGHVLVQILQCQHCPSLAVSMGDEHGGTRLTRHKCAGAWTTILSESVDPALILEELEATKRMAKDADSRQPVLQGMPDGVPPQAEKEPR